MTEEQFQTAEALKARINGMKIFRAMLDSQDIVVSHTFTTHGYNQTNHIRIDANNPLFQNLKEFGDNEFIQKAIDERISQLEAEFLKII